MRAAPTYGRMTAWLYGSMLGTGRFGSTRIRYVSMRAQCRRPRGCDRGMYACAVQAGIRPRGLHARWLAAAATFGVLWKSSPIDVTSHATGGRSPGSSY